MLANTNPSTDGYRGKSIIGSMAIHFRKAMVLLVVLIVAILLIAGASGRLLIGIIIVALHLLTALLVWIYCVVLVRRGSL